MYPPKTTVIDSKITEKEATRLDQLIQALEISLIF